MPRVIVSHAASASLVLGLGLASTAAAQTPPTVIGCVAPAVVNAGDSVLFTLQAAPGQPPLSQVVVEAEGFSGINGNTIVPLSDRGVGGDVVAGDHVYAVRQIVRPDAIEGTYRVRLTASGEPGSDRGGAVDVFLTVLGRPGPPSGVGTVSSGGIAAPLGSAPRGGAVTVMVKVNPGGIPISTGLRVTLDLSRFGLSATTVLSDEGGSACDGAPGDRVFTTCFLVPTALVAGSPFDMAGTISDAQGRSAPLIVTTAITEPGDADSDGLSDACEVTFGLDPYDPVLAAGGTGDPDGDGRTNAVECAASTHPRGFFTRYLAEGASNAFFRTRIALFNPSFTPAHALVTFTREAGGEPRRIAIAVAPHAIVNLMPADTATLGEGPFSTIVESDVELIVDRVVTFGADEEGSHIETAVHAPATTWVAQGGGTAGPFAVFYMLQNPGDVPADVDVRYERRPFDPVLTKRYVVPARTRRTIPVDDEELPAGSGQHPLASTIVSARIDVANGVPIVVERAVYLSRDGHPFGGGFAAAPVAPAMTWYFAEGATGGFFDEFLDFTNDNPAAAQIDVVFMPEGGPGFPPITRQYVLAAHSNVAIWVDAIPGLYGRALSAAVGSSLPIVAQRAMWWPGNIDTWREGHLSYGATTRGPRWAIAGLEVAGDHDAHSYVLVSGGGALTVYPEGGAGPISCGTTPSPFTGRHTFDVNACLPSGNHFAAAIVDGGPNTVVEWATYRSANGEPFVAGGAALAVPIP